MIKLDKHTIEITDQDVLLLDDIEVSDHIIDYPDGTADIIRMLYEEVMKLKTHLIEADIAIKSWERNYGDEH